ncbi:MAG: hypothetical protein C4290_11500, partial [Chloroflexota bacterium]
MSHVPRASVHAGGRTGHVRRETNETVIEAVAGMLRPAVNLDGGGTCEVRTGIGMLDHLIEQVARHACIDITLIAHRSDLERDAHHLVEDAGIALGQALARALGDRAGIVR